MHKNCTTAYVKKRDSIGAMCKKNWKEVTVISITDKTREKHTTDYN